MKVRNNKKEIIFTEAQKKEWGITRELTESEWAAIEAEEIAAEPDYSPCLAAKDIAIGDTIYSCYPNMGEESHPVQVVQIFPGAVSQSGLLVVVLDDQGTMRRLDAAWLSKFKLN